MADRTIVMLPFVYEIEGTLKGKKNTQTYKVLDVVPVAVEHIPASAAPVVLEAAFGTYRRHDGTLLLPLKGELPNGEWRRQDERVVITGDVLAQKMAAFFDEICTEPTARKFVSNFSQTWDPVATALRPVIGNLEGAQRAEAYSFSKIVSSNESERRAAMESAWTSGIVVLDGEVWTKAPEPVIKVGGTTYIRNGQMEICIRENAAKGTHFSKTFRMDRLEDAVAFAERMAAGHDVVMQDIGTLLDADGWQFDDVGYDTREQARYVLEQLNSMAHQVMWMERSVFDAVIEIRGMDVDTTDSALLASRLVALGKAARTTVHEKGLPFAKSLWEIAEDIEWLWARAGRNFDEALSSDDLDDISSGMGMGR